MNISLPCIDEIYSTHLPHSAAAALQMTLMCRFYVIK